MTEQGGPRHSAPRTLTDHEGRDAQVARDDAEVARRAKRAIAKLRGDRPDDDEPAERPDAAAKAQDPTARLLRRAIYVVGLLIALGVVAFAALAIYTLSTGSDVAELTSDGAVSANRVKAVGEIRGYPGMPCPDPLAYNADTLTLECANRFVVAAGGDPVPDPGDDVTPTQMGAAVGRALARFDRSLERTEGARDGVSTPDQGRFRGAR